MSLIISTPHRIAIALIVSAAFITGCSSSGSNTNDANTATSAGTTDGTTDGVINDGGSTAGTTAGGGSTTGTDATGGTGGGSVPGDETDPKDRSSTRVNFDITVPVYVSDALQVRVVWDDKDIAAQWDGDEFWSVIDDFPTETEHLLTITFYDDNGGITLGSYEIPFKTGTNAGETIRVTADQFNTIRWDNDQDGISNLNELIAGTSPNDAAALEVRPAFAEPLKMAILARASRAYEDLIPKLRPYYENEETNQVYINDPYTPEVMTKYTIDLDESGTGSFTDTYRSWEPSNVHVENKIATRTNNNRAITWKGEDHFSDSSAGLVEDLRFDVTTRMVDAQTRQQEGKVDRSKSGDFSGGNFTISMTYNLTGRVISGSSSCKPVAGTITYGGDSDRYSEEGRALTGTTVTKAVDDQYWLVTVKNSDGDLTAKYQVEAFGANMYCDFPEFQ